LGGHARDLLAALPVGQTDLPGDRTLRWLTLSNTARHVWMSIVCP
jgi:hypothetical protein